MIIIIIGTRQVFLPRNVADNASRPLLNQHPGKRRRSRTLHDRSPMQ